MSPLDLTFNFIGVCVVDWRPAFRFFTETIGIQYHLEPRHGDWAGLGRSGSAADEQSARSAVFELFDRGRPVAERRWGLNQGIRPGFQVSDLETTVKKLGLPVVSEVRPWGRTAEFDTVEGIRFALAELPGAPFSDDFSAPLIGHVAIKCADFAVMQNFYGDILGLARSESRPDYALFTQPDGFPSIFLEPGGSSSAFDPRGTPWEDNAVRACPVFISFTTKELQAVYTHLRSNGVPIQREIRYHPSWGGTDFHVADPDGNGIQIVQY